MGVKHLINLEKVTTRTQRGCINTTCSLMLFILDPWFVCTPGVYTSSSNIVINRSRLQKIIKIILEEGANLVMTK